MLMMAVLHMLILSLLLAGIPSDANSVNRSKRQAVALRFSNVFGSHMVLQRERINRLWGFADVSHAGSDLTLTVTYEGISELYQSTLSNYSDTESQWSVDIEPKPAGGPYNFTVTAVGESVTLEDVLIGDVYICSGQSNMEFTTAMMFGGPEEVELAANYPNIRLFTAAHATSYDPLAELQSIIQYWSIASPESVGGPDYLYFSAVCWVYGRRLYDQIQIPIGLISSNWGGTKIEAWSSPDALAQCSASRVKRQAASEPSVLFNAMIYPFLPMSITGVLWYQGEGNSGSPIYYCQFHAMIEDWRSKFYSLSGNHNDPVFPFGFVQLAPWRNSTDIGGYPTIRWQQTYNFGYVPNSVMQNVFMAVAIDLPDFSSPYGSIHPRDKENIGIRLLRGGLAVAYNDASVTFQGPFPVSIQNNLDSTLTVTYQANKEIELRGDFGFEVCCNDDPSVCENMDDASWTATTIISSTTSSVTIQYNCGSSGVNGVRYLWSESPCPYLQCPVYSTDAQLPAPPFVFIDNGTGNIITTRT